MAVDDVLLNGHGYVLISHYSQSEVMRWIFPTNHTLLTCAIYCGPFEDQSMTFYLLLLLSTSVLSDSV